MDLTRATLEIFSKLEQKWLSHYDTSKKIRVLSIDGGGTNPTFAGEVLIKLEEHIRCKTNDPDAFIPDFFDIITGTGIGAILAVMITADGGSGRPLFSATEAVEYLMKRRYEMFRLVRNGIFRQRKRYSGKSMDLVLKEALVSKIDGKVLTLRDTCKPLLVPCFDLNSSAPFVFSRADAIECSGFDFPLWKVCRATSATPAAAVTHVLHNKRDFPNVTGVEDLLVISIGNGQQICESGNRGGKVRDCDTSRVVDIVLDGVSETVDQLLGNAFCWNRADYVRIQGKMEEKGVETLSFGGKRLLTVTNGERVEGFVQRLVASGKTSLPPSPCKLTAVSQLANGR